MKIQSSIKIAAALAAVSFFSSAQACKLHITNLANGFYTPHPLSVPVSVATRQAIDANALTDIPRQSEQRKIAALEQIEQRLDQLLAAAQDLKANNAAGFSLFLTESNHWVNFVEDNGKLSIHIHQTAAQQQSLVLVMSDTALKNILDKRLTMQTAVELGIVQLSIPGDAGLSALERLSLIFNSAS